MQQPALETVVHPVSSEYRHASDGTEWSVVLTWNDPVAGIGGCWRIGREPEHAGGIAVVTGGVVTVDRGPAFRRNATNLLGKGDVREHGFGARGGAYAFTYDGTRTRVTAQDGPLEVDLFFEDFYERTDFFPKSAGSLVEEFASNHFATSGRVVGHVTLDGRTYAVDGLGHRDHSWGVRRWNTILKSPLGPCTFGHDLSMGTLVWHAVGGSLGGFAYVVRDGVVTKAADVDVVVHMHHDGVGFRSGELVITLPDGERHEVTCAPLEGLVNEHHDVAWLDGVGVATLADGRRVFCDLEVSTNPRAGRGPLTSALKRDPHRRPAPVRDRARPRPRGDRRAQRTINSATSTAQTVMT